jgi:hypothetical protein
MNVGVQRITSYTRTMGSLVPRQCTFNIGLPVVLTNT